MINSPKGFAFHRGAAVGILGAILWMLTFSVQILVLSYGGPQLVVLEFLSYAGILGMLGGPLWFWALLPVYHFLR